MLLFLSKYSTSVFFLVSFALWEGFCLLSLVSHVFCTFNVYKKKRKKKRRKRQKRRKREKEKKEIRKKKMEKTAINIIAGYPLIRFAIVEKTKCDAQHFFFFQPKFSYIISTQTDRPIPQGNGDGFLCKVDPLPAILILLYGNTNLPSQANPCTRARS